MFLPSQPQLIVVVVVVVVVAVAVVADVKQEICLNFVIIDWAIIDPCLLKIWDELNKNNILLNMSTMKFNKGQGRAVKHFNFNLEVEKLSSCITGTCREREMYNSHGSKTGPVKGEAS